MRVYLSVDFEGVGGIAGWEQTDSAHPEFALGQDLVLGEVNAAIEGAVAAGATDVVVNDAHWRMRNLDPARLAGRARYLSGHRKPAYMMEGLDAGFDAAVFVGYHASAGSAAPLSHTYEPDQVWEVRLNGEPVGEAGVNLLAAQGHGVPLALLVGDDRAGAEVRRILPRLSTVATKRAVGRFAAEHAHPDATREEIRRAAAEALARPADLERSPIALPARLEVTMQDEGQAEMATWIGGVERVAPRTVALEGRDCVALYRRFVAVLYLTAYLSGA